MRHSYVRLIYPTKFYFRLASGNPVSIKYHAEDTNLPVEKKLNRLTRYVYTEKGACNACKWTWFVFSVKVTHTFIEKRILILGLEIITGTYRWRSSLVSGLNFIRSIHIFCGFSEVYKLSQDNIFRHKGYIIAEFCVNILRSVTTNFHNS
jgi:hypothetical protein